METNSRNESLSLSEQRKAAEAEQRLAEMQKLVESERRTAKEEYAAKLKREQENSEVRMQQLQDAKEKQILEQVEQFTSKMRLKEEEMTQRLTESIGKTQTMQAVRRQMVQTIAGESAGSGMAVKRGTAESPVSLSMIKNTFRRTSVVSGLPSAVDIETKLKELSERDPRLAAKMAEQENSADLPAPDEDLSKVVEQPEESEDDASDFLAKFRRKVHGERVDDKAAAREMLPPHEPEAAAFNVEAADHHAAVTNANEETQDQLFQKTSAQSEQAQTVRPQQNWKHQESSQPEQEHLEPTEHDLDVEREAHVSADEVDDDEDEDDEYEEEDEDTTIGSLPPPPPAKKSYADTRALATETLRRAEEEELKFVSNRDQDKELLASAINSYTLGRQQLLDVQKHKDLPLDISKALAKQSEMIGKKIGRLTVLYRKKPNQLSSNAMPPIVHAVDDAAEVHMGDDVSPHEQNTTAAYESTATSSKAEIRGPAAAVPPTFNELSGMARTTLRSAKEAEERGKSDKNRGLLEKAIESYRLGKNQLLNVANHTDADRNVAKAMTAQADKTDKKIVKLTSMLDSLQVQPSGATATALPGPPASNMTASLPKDAPTSQLAVASALSGDGGEEIYALEKSSAGFGFRYDKIEARLIGLVEGGVGERAKIPVPCQVLRVGGAAVSTKKDLLRALQTFSFGDTVEFVVRAEGHRETPNSHDQQPNNGRKAATAARGPAAAVPPTFNELSEMARTTLRSAKEAEERG
eukprot:SAG31_NODE_5917_length_2256_cov_4.927677_1_plen_751_part_11